MLTYNPTILFCIAAAICFMAALAEPFVPPLAHYLYAFAICFSIIYRKDW